MILSVNNNWPRPGRTWSNKSSCSNLSVQSASASYSSPLTHLSLYMFFQHASTDISTAEIDLNDSSVKEPKSYRIATSHVKGRWAQKDRFNNVNCHKNKSKIDCCQQFDSKVSECVSLKKRLKGCVLPEPLLIWTLWKSQNRRINWLIEFFLVVFFPGIVTLHWNKQYADRFVIYFLFFSKFKFKCTTWYIQLLCVIQNISNIQTLFKNRHLYSCSSNKSWNWTNHTGPLSPSSDTTNRSVS